MIPYFNGLNTKGVLSSLRFCRSGRWWLWSGLLVWPLLRWPTHISWCLRGCRLGYLVSPPCRFSGRVALVHSYTVLRVPRGQASMHDYLFAARLLMSYWSKQFTLPSHSHCGRGWPKRVVTGRQSLQTIYHSASWKVVARTIWFIPWMISFTPWNKFYCFSGIETLRSREIRGGTFTYPN